MKHAACTRGKGTRLALEGGTGKMVKGLLEQWLLVAPKANPGMLEMLADRDVSPLRSLVPWAGEFAGKYLTSAVEMLQLTRDKRLKDWLKQFVALLLARQARDGYLGPWPRENRLANKAPNSGTNGKPRPTWDTWGHYHIMLGLLLWSEEAGDRKALQAACRVADLLCDKYLGKKRPRLVDTGSTEMNLAPIHVLCMLHRRTGTEKYLAMARQIADEFAAVRKGEPLAGDYLRQPLAGKEFFETPRPRWESLHPIMGLVELYWITGEEQYRQAFETIWWSIVKLDRHNNGGFSSGEKATGNPYHLAAIETCCTIAWSAMSVEMLKLTGNSLVADELELSFMNSVQGMFSPTGRWATYDTPMNGVRRASAHQIVFQAREGTPELNCCSVNAPRGFGLLSEWALMSNRKGLLLNYYGPSRMSARAGGVQVVLTQETDYPREGRVAITVDPSRHASFALQLRIPHWSRRTRVKLNGRKVKGVKAGEYLVLERSWRRGDRIELALDLSLHVWHGEQDCKGQVSLYRGPVLLTYDRRFNRRDGQAGKPVVRPGDPWDRAGCELPVPRIDLAQLRLKRQRAIDWLAPKMLFRAEVGRGETIFLCDFASAGAGGSMYRSWLPVKQKKGPAPFRKEAPLRSEAI